VQKEENEGNSFGLGAHTGSRPTKNELSTATAVAAAATDAAWVQLDTARPGSPCCCCCWRGWLAGTAALATVPAGAVRLAGVHKASQLADLAWGWLVMGCGGVQAVADWEEHEGQVATKGLRGGRRLQRGVEGTQVVVSSTASGDVESASNMRLVGIAGEADVGLLAEK